MENSTQEIVDGEIEFMRSAYFEEFEDLRLKDPWKIYRPPDVEITIKNKTHTHVMVKLSIKCTAAYPHEVPEIIIKYTEGISSKLVCCLENDLRKSALQLASLGQVCMLDITQKTEAFLEDNSQPLHESIYEEMVADQKAKELADQQMKIENKKIQDQLDKDKNKKMMDEISKVKEEMKRQKEENKLARQRSSISTLESIGFDPSTLESPLIKKRDRTRSEGSDSSKLFLSYMTNVTLPVSGKQEKSILVTSSLSERRSDYRQVYLVKDKHTSETSVLYFWSLKAKRTGRKKNHTRVGEEKQLEDNLNKLSILEKEFSSLLRLSNENVVNYSSMKCQRLNDMISIYLLQDYVLGLSLSYFIDNSIALHYPLLKYITEGVLKGLDYLHQNNVVHRDLRDSCIYIDKEKGVVRVADFSIERRVEDCVVEFYSIKPEYCYPESPGRGGKKGDVYRLGLVLFSLLNGCRVTQVVPVLGNNLSPDFENFLSRCLEISEQDRWSTEQLLDHSFLLHQNNDEHIQDGYQKNDNPSLDRDVKDEDKENHLLSQPHVSLTGSTRFSKDFVQINTLGQGGFGYVFKARNIVDGQVYAVKRIALSRRTTKGDKIEREVKLLSSLNHENVVRYYTSWIETLTDEIEMKSSDTETSDNGEIEPSNSSDVIFKEESSYGDVKYDVTSSVRVSSQQSRFRHQDGEDDSEDTEEEDWLMGSIGPIYRNDSSDDVLFYDSNAEDQVDGSEREDSEEKSQVNRCYKYLYIQMQFCENDTLRQAIDKGLYLDGDRVWRLLREMVNGLDYIHSQQLIHRDLKPGNVLLDSHDRIKIGDFGLATVAMKTHVNVSVVNNGDSIEVPDTTGSLLSGQVGTTFYIAPEIMKSQGKLAYTSKVDIYSLGVIFFEMCYPPLKTGMERAEILTNLRKPEIIIPTDFNKGKDNRSYKLIKLLLQQDENLRPTSDDLLKSSLLPPPTAEEQKFISTLEERLKNFRSTDYQNILHKLFKRNAHPELEATLEIEQDLSFNYWKYFNFDHIKGIVTSVFKEHGGIWIPTNFYIPKGSFYQGRDNIVTVMYRKGELLSAQFELRYPFARFVAKHDIKRLKRYCIDRVQRSNKIAGIHPRELFECAFDIVSPRYDATESCAKIILIGQHVIQSVTGMNNQEVVIRVGHIDLVYLILKHCGIDEEFHNKIVLLLKHIRSDTMTVDGVGDDLVLLGVKKNCVDILKGFLTLEGSLEETVAALSNRGLMSRRRNLIPQIKAVIHDLTDIFNAARVIGVKFRMVLRPMFVADPSLYSGFMCQFLQLNNRKKIAVQNILAQGGTFDQLIRYHSKQISKICESENFPSAVGISFPLEKFSRGGDSKFFTEIKKTLNYNTEHILYVLVISVGSKCLKERVDIVEKLKNLNIRGDHCFVLNNEEIESIVEHSLNPPFVVILSSDKALIRIQDDHFSRPTERKVPLTEIVEFLSKHINVYDNTSSINLNNSNRVDCSKSNGSVILEDYEVNIEYFTFKKIKSKDGKIDNQILRDLKSLVGSRWNIPLGSVIDVWALDVDRQMLLGLGQLDIDSSQKNFMDSLSELKNRFPRTKEYIDSIGKMLLRKIFDRKKNDPSFVLILYSIPFGCIKKLI